MIKCIKESIQELNNVESAFKIVNNNDTHPMVLQKLPVENIDFS